MPEEKKEAKMARYNVYVKWVSVCCETGLIEIEFDTGKSLCYDAGELAEAILEHEARQQ